MSTQTTLAQKNLGKMHANMHIRRIARERKVDFYFFLAKIQKAGLWRKLADAITHDKEHESILKEIEFYELD